MPSVFDTAKYVLDKVGPMTTMKLEKLCYYAQAWSLVWDEAELFSEEFEAWANGPVCRELRDWHHPRFKLESAGIPADHLTDDPFTADQVETLDAVLRDYGDKSGQWLRELARMEDPWKKARSGVAVGAHCSRVISKGGIARGI